MRLTESEKQIAKYLANQENPVTLMSVLQAMSDDYTTEIILNGIRSLKRRCFLEDTPNGDRASHEKHPSLLKINPILKYYITAHSSCRE